MTAKPEIVAYLQENLKKFSVEQLRGQLAQEGVSAFEFDEALRIAKEKPAPSAPKKASPAGKIFLAGGLAAVVIAALVSLDRKPEEEVVGTPRPAAPSLESAFIDTGRYGYVVRLPKDYVAVENFQDDAKSIELVYFCKGGTDPTQFLNEGLYGQLGIVRLRVEPSPFPNDLNGLNALSRAVTARANGRGEKFTIKNISVSSMRGIQLRYDLPFARVESFILGDKTLYSFMAGDEDEIYKDIVYSLRDANSET